ncbi:tRNA lysidine(34) synthetase TilS [Pseudodonghicola sp.]|uniref:tRNA lysidine(34) synthetase TilS n=1 Tax=Pseudodonghicola sp. TaxID=1969463 RepID=UPI003A971DEF
MSRSDDDLLATVRAALGPEPPETLGIALSGGGDSVALLHLLSRCFAGSATRLFAATVDHGLRPEAAEEAREAGRLCEALGIPHDILRWQGWDGQGNLQDHARQARYRLLIDWAGGRGIGALALGHTADDQAETLLMRLGRAAGPAGLRGMAGQSLRDGVLLLRPLLALSRADLRAYLTRQGLGWVEDPSNQDDHYTRVRARAALAGLAPLGITAEGLCDVAANMARADQALGWATFQAAGDLAQIRAGAVAFETRGFTLLPEEIARRLITGAIGWIGRPTYPPRRAPVERLLSDLRQGGAGALCGCRVMIRRGAVWVCREYNAVRGLRGAPDALWDGRWRLEGPAPAGAELAALGPKGLALCPDRRDTGLPSAVLEAAPALWLDGRLIAAPLAEVSSERRLHLVDRGAGFRAGLLSH